jgi:hypothetical protein
MAVEWRVGCDPAVQNGPSGVCGGVATVPATDFAEGDPMTATATRTVSLPGIGPVDIAVSDYGDGQPSSGLPSMASASSAASMPSRPATSRASATPSIKMDM